MEIHSKQRPKGKCMFSWENHQIVVWEGLNFAYACLVITFEESYRGIYAWIRSSGSNGVIFRIMQILHNHGTTFLPKLRWFVQLGLCQLFMYPGDANRFKRFKAIALLLRRPNCNYIPDNAVITINEVQL